MGKSEKNYYSLTWTVEFEHSRDVCYFAHCYPYTYSDMQVRTIDTLRVQLEYISSGKTSLDLPYFGIRLFLKLYIGFMFPILTIRLQVSHIWKWQFTISHTNCMTVFYFILFFYIRFLNLILNNRIFMNIVACQAGRVSSFCTYPDATQS